MRLVFDSTGERKFIVGCKEGVLFPMKSGVYQTGVAFNGLREVPHNPDGGEDNDYYADDMKYLTIRSAENFKFSIGCYFTPKEFDQCDGTLTVVPGAKIGQQTRANFGFVYKSTVGNDTDGIDYGYQLHIIYNASAAPTERAHSTIGETPEPGELSFECSTTPIKIEGEAYKKYKPIAHIEIDSKEVSAEGLKTLEDIIYGTDDADPRLPLPKEVFDILNGEQPTPTELYTVEFDEEYFNQNSPVQYMETTLSRTWTQTSEGQEFPYKATDIRDSAHSEPYYIRWINKRTGATLNDYFVPTENMVVYPTFE